MAVVRSGPDELQLVLAAVKDSLGVEVRDLVHGLAESFSGGVVRAIETAVRS